MQCLSFYCLLYRNVDIRVKTDALVKRNNISRCIIKNVYLTFKAYIRQKMWKKFNYLIASEFRKSKLLKKTIINWKLSKDID